VVFAFTTPFAEPQGVPPKILPAFVKHTEEERAGDLTTLPALEWQIDPGVGILFLKAGFGFLRDVCAFQR